MLSNCDDALYCLLCLGSFDPINWCNVSHAVQRISFPFQCPLPTINVPVFRYWITTNCQDSLEPKFKMWQCWRMLSKVWYKRPISERISRQLWNRYLQLYSTFNSNTELELHESMMRLWHAWHVLHIWDISDGHQQIRFIFLIFDIKGPQRW